MLSNAYFLAKFRFDTAENEPAKNLLIFPILKNQQPVALTDGQVHYAADSSFAHWASLPAVVSAPKARCPRTRMLVAKFWQIFGKMLLVFGCIGTDFCK